MSMYSNRLQPALQNLLQRVVWFFHQRSLCLTHISADVCGGRKSLVKPVMRQNRVVRFFHPRSSCTMTHISADVQRITLNASCMTISGERTDQLDIFCHITGFTSDFLSFIDVEYSVLSRSPSIISRPIALCPPSISSKSRRTSHVFGVCLTVLQGLRDPLGWEPPQATAGATADAEVTVAGAFSSRLPRDRANVGAAANTVAGASGGLGFLNRGGGKCRRHEEDRGTASAKGVWGGEVSQKLF